MLREMASSNGGFYHVKGTCRSSLDHTSMRVFRKRVVLLCKQFKVGKPA